MCSQGFNPRFLSLVGIDFRAHFYCYGRRGLAEDYNIRG
jgi:hypothetical protein